MDQYYVWVHRLGEEVKVFRDLGWEALGIDLYPGKDNPYVIQGDFHDLQFETNQFGIIYTNSLDHAIKLDQVIQECIHVLKFDGIMFVDITTGSKHIGKQQLNNLLYESMVLLNYIVLWNFPMDF